MIKNKVFVFFLLTILFVLKVPTVVSNPTVDIKAHLVQYGYLESSDVDPKTLKTALEKFQQTFDLSVTGVADAPTIRLMSSRRCGRPNNTPMYSKLVENKWRKRHLTYKIQNVTNSISEEVLKGIFEDLIYKWTDNIDLTITESRTRRGDIDIYFSEQDGKGKDLAYAYFPEHGDIYFDIDEKWTVNKPLSDDETYIRVTAGHELGHSLGLDHQEMRESIMFPYYVAEVFEPSAGDKALIKQVYGASKNLDNSVLCEDPQVDAIIKSSNPSTDVLFKGSRFWLFTKEGLESGPFDIDVLFPGLPDNVDCGFAIGDIMYIFKDHVFYKYRPKKKTYTKKLISSGFDMMPSDIDAAFFNPSSGILYVFKASRFYEFNINKPVKRRLNTNGTSILTAWPGVPNDLEAATLLDNGTILFISGGRCLIFDLSSERVTADHSCKSYLFKCN